MFLARYVIVQSNGMRQSPEISRDDGSSGGSGGLIVDD